MGIEVANKDGVVGGVKKLVEVGRVLCRARGVGGEVDVDEIGG